MELLYAFEASGRNRSYIIKDNTRPAIQNRAAARHVQFTVTPLLTRKVTIISPTVDDRSWVGVGRSRRGAPAPWPQRAGARRCLRLRCGARCRSGGAADRSGGGDTDRRAAAAGTAVAFAWLHVPVTVYAVPSADRRAAGWHGSSIRAAARIPRAGLGLCSRSGGRFVGRERRATGGCAR